MKRTSVFIVFALLISFFCDSKEKGNPNIQNHAGGTATTADSFVRRR